MDHAPAKKEFLFLLDDDDEWSFGVKLVRTGAVEPGARYPRVVARQGKAPPQYPDPGEEGDWDENQSSAPRFAAAAAPGPRPQGPAGAGQAAPAAAGRPHRALLPGDVGPAPACFRRCRSPT